MIIRIVKMTFEPDSVQEFQQIFNASKQLIRNFEGCTHLDLLNDTADKTIFFTYSCWESEAHLNAYRNSELFISVWNKTKVLFSSKAEAWSVNKLMSVS
ncbi:MAG: antibiotic biosynthesis monooxygenase [Bacteroidetes bacterium]|nr:antibiotic biosynthesis monooxygenase [Bacteroidota bacterium]